MLRVAWDATTTISTRRWRIGGSNAPYIEPSQVNCLSPELRSSGSLREKREWPRLNRQVGRDRATGNAVLRGLGVAVRLEYPGVVRG